jgi:hypothetical protein
MKKSIILIGVAALAFGACKDKDKTYELTGYNNHEWLR